VSARDARTVSRRDFLKFCSTVTAAIGLGPAYGPRLARAFAAGARPTVLWLHFAECTACTEAVLRISPDSTPDHTLPWFDDLIFHAISLDYHETLLAASGSTVESILDQTATDLAGSFFCVVEGAIPTADNGNYGMVGGRTMLEIAQTICPKARAIIAIGTCASFGGLPAASPNPTGARGVLDALPGLTVPVINCSGCPPNPVTFVGIIANYLLLGTTPDLDRFHRPRFAYWDLGTVHDQCPLQDDPVRCMIQKGCKGPITENNCPTIRFNDAANFPMLAGHPCIGCSQPDFWDRYTGFYSRNFNQVSGVRPGATPAEARVQSHAAALRERFDLLGRRVGRTPATASAAARGDRTGAAGQYLTRTGRSVVKKVKL